VIKRKVDKPRRIRRRQTTEHAASQSQPLMISAIAQLSVAHRELIRRSYYLGWTTTQIAADLNITDSLVKSRLHCALRALDVNVKRIIGEGSERKRIEPDNKLSTWSARGHS
jgi:RNA polymerase sigma-70 factor, ECF subfamily